MATLLLALSIGTKIKLLCRLFRFFLANGSSRTDLGSEKVQERLAKWILFSILFIISSLQGIKEASETFLILESILIKPSRPSTIIACAASKLTF